MRVLLFFAVSAGAFAQQHMLDYVLPRGGSRGTTVEATLSGRFLNDPREVMFYGSGIKATGVQPGAKPAEEVKVKLEIAPDCPVGEHVLRLRTATALSEAITFWVSPYPTIRETEKKIGDNDTLEKAQVVPLNSTVEGQILPGDQMDVDYYWVDVKQGQRISVEIESVRLGTLHSGGENDLMVRILDFDGKEVARNDDSAMFVQDPLVSILAPRSGIYFVEIKQQQCWYRAHIGSFSRPTAVFPAGGRAGEQLDVRVIGDPLGERTERVTLPQRIGDVAYFAGKPGEQPPSPNTLRVSPYPNVLKTPGDAPTLVPALPAALNGIYDHSGRPDIYRFTAKKGEAWKVRVYSRGLGAPMDPKIWIRAEGSAKNILEADDSKLADLGLLFARGSWFTKETLDPVAVFKPTADGAYELGIEDTRGAASRDHVYRIEIEPLRDTIYTHISMNDGYQIPRLVGLIVPQGNRWTIDVQLAQGLGNAFKGEIELEATGLPRGVTMIAPRFPAGAIRMPVQFVAAPGAEQQSALVELRARPVDRKTPLESGSRQAFALTDRAGELPWHFVFLDKFALAVTQPAPFHIEVEQPEIAVAQNGELSLKVKAIRHDGFKDAIEIQPDWLPQGVSREGTVTIPAGKDEAQFKIRADGKAAPGTYRVAMNATTTGGDGFSGIGRIRVSSPFIELKISEPYLTVDLKRASVERGQRGQIVATIRQNKPFQGNAAVVLKRLPKGVKMMEPAPSITSTDTQVAFTIEADADALVGLYKEITCEVTVTENGQSIHQQSGSGVLRVDPARTVASR